MMKVMIVVAMILRSGPLIWFLAKAVSISSGMFVQGVQTSRSTQK